MHDGIGHMVMPPPGQTPPLADTPPGRPPLADTPPGRPPPLADTPPGQIPPRTQKIFILTANTHFLHVFF